MSIELVMPSNHLILSHPLLFLPSIFPCIQISQEAGKLVWYSHLFKNFPQFIVIHTVKGSNVVNEAEVDALVQEVEIDHMKDDFHKCSMYLSLVYL